MANTIRLKRKSTGAPLAGDLQTGELAIQTADGLLFWKDDAGTVHEIDLGDLEEVGYAVMEVERLSHMVGLLQAAVSGITQPAASGGDGSDKLFRAMHFT